MNDHSIRFGLCGLSAQTPSGTREEYARNVRAAVEYAALGERAGFNSIWVTEHHVSSDAHLPAPLPMLAAIAENTEGVGIGTNILLAPLHQPVRLAEEAAFVDQLSQGRLTLGLALGYRREEFAALGVPFEGRRKRLVEAVRILRNCWSGEELELRDGESVAVRPLPWQVSGPDLWLGGWVEAAVRRACRIGDGYVAAVGAPKDLEQRVAWVEDEGPMDRFPFAITMNGFVAPRGAWERVAPGARHVLDQYIKWYSRKGSGARGRIDSGRSDRIPRNFIVGTPEECARQMHVIVRMMAALPSYLEPHILIKLSFPSVGKSENSESIRLFGEEVVPLLREYASTGGDGPV